MNAKQALEYAANALIASGEAGSASAALLLRQLADDTADAPAPTYDSIYQGMLKSGLQQALTTKAGKAIIGVGLEVELRDTIRQAAASATYSVCEAFDLEA